MKKYINTKTVKQLVAGNGNNDTVNNSDPLQSSFSELSGLAILHTMIRRYVIKMVI